MTFLGCDPGLTGAFAVLTLLPDGTQSIRAQATPVVWDTVGKGRRRRYDVRDLCQCLRALPVISLAYLERQSARPLQGRSSIFTTGYGEGLWAGLLTACGIPHVVVDPIRWRSQVGLSRVAEKRQRKEDVRIAACRRFPAIPLKLEHADAVMLAVAAAIEHGLMAQESTYA